MRDIAARTGGAILAPAVLCVLAAGSAFAEPPPELGQRPAETVQRPSVPETAQRTCLPRDGADAKLRKEFGEKVLGRGVSDDGTLVEIFLAPSGTFTVIKTTPTGLSCVVDFGEGWQTLNQLESTGFTPDDLKVAPTPF
ncbi:MAG TPA: hypothetical protein VGQ35_20940 [Dongiaceae bacterium]|jgi:hypothetical protein|nr:hypothetical protein [Dongiaceae bacterium]